MARKKLPHQRGNKRLFPLRKPEVVNQETSKTSSQIENDCKQMNLFESKVQN